MRPIRRVAVLLLGWTAAVSAAHLALNVDWPTLLNDRLPSDQRKFNVAFIPVT